MKLRPVSLAVLALLSGLALQANAEEARHSYIIQLADAPVASYTGKVSGLKATKPAAGQRLDVNATDVQAYINYLEQKADSVAAVVPAAHITHNYKIVFNGFAARLTPSEVRALKKNSAVAAITADEARTLDTNFTSTFLGLDKAGSGLWDQLGGKSNAGENIVIGIIDGGIWPENPAYADRVDANGVPTFDPSANQVYGAAPAGWKGKCETGQGFAEHHCNNKLIGARYFDAGFKQSGKPMHWTDFVSPRDSVGGAEGHGGHGTHTSSTAGGNNNTPATVAGQGGIGRLSGMAPRARIAAYKVCWTYPEPAAADGTGSKNSCFGSDSVAAIEAAVADGVNVINFSISGSQTSVVDPVETAFRNATNAGVFVAVSAGNSGPANAVAHISPWLTTVAASTHNRLNASTLSLSNGASYVGASYNQAPLPATATMLAQDAATVPFASLSAADKVAAARCYTETDRAAYGGTAAAALDPAKATGKILLCERGSSARTDKGVAVAQAGGAGMILVDVSAATVIASDRHVLPAVHLSLADGIVVKNWIAANAGGTASMSQFSPVAGSTPAPVMADFSSRGPNKHNANMLKPDLTAPGVDILAGVTPAKDQAGRDAIANGTEVPEAAWESYQGTSMSSPHVAGLGALLRQQHPTWSPAAIKSALMTTAFTTFDDKKPGMQNGLLPWAQGAGHVSPNNAADPGLVYDASETDYLRYMCGIAGTLPASSCVGVAPLAPYNLNVPSLTASAVLGKITLTRTVTNVSAQASTYTASASLPGFSVAVSPSTLTLAPGAKASFNVTLTNVSAAANAWNYGSLVWSDGVHKVKSPLTARLAPLSVPANLYSEEASGSKLFTIGTGFNGALGLLQGGLKAATRTAQTVGADDSADSGVAACKAGGSDGVKMHSVTIPAGTLAARFALYDEDTSGFTAGHSDDLDLLVIGPTGATAGTSGTETSNEKVTLSVPAAGEYKVCVIGYAPYGGSSNYTLSSWVVGNGETAGNFTVLPPGMVYTGGTATMGASWSGLGKAKHLGAFVYSVGGTLTNISMLEVDTTDPLPEAEGNRTQRVTRN